MAVDVRTRIGLQSCGKSSKHAGLSQAQERRSKSRIGLIFAQLRALLRQQPRAFSQRPAPCGPQREASVGPMRFGRVFVAFFTFLCGRGQRK